MFFTHGSECRNRGSIFDFDLVLEVNYFSDYWRN